MSVGVFLPDVVRSRLLALWSDRYGDGSVLLQWPVSATRGKQGQALVFETSAGTRLSNGNFRNRVLTPACRRANITPPATAHTLRDSYASLSVAAGVSVAALSANLGHSTVSTTLRHYVGAMPADRAAVAVALNSEAVIAALSGPASLPLPEDSGGSSQLTAE